MKFLDFTRKYKRYKKDINSITQRILKKGIFILGPEAEKFERNLAKYIGTQYAVGLNSATDALHLSLRALDIGSGSEVITVSCTAPPTVNAICMSGATPVFVDVDPLTLNMDSKQIEAKITKRTKALMPVHLFGYPADMGAIMRIARKYNLYVIEDVAQAIGAQYNDKKVGSIGDIGCFSFYPTKNLGTFGDAGAIVTNDKKIAQIVKSLRMYGETKKFYSGRIGVNSRLDSLHAGFLNWGLTKINKWNKERDELARLYIQELKNVKEITLPPQGDKIFRRVWHLFVIQARNRDKLREYLSKHRIATMVHYPWSVYEQPAYRFLKYTAKQLPVSKKITKYILSLPLYPEMTVKEVRQVCRAIKNFYEK